MRETGMPPNVKLMERSMWHRREWGARALRHKASSFRDLKKGHKGRGAK